MGSHHRAPTFLAGGTCCRRCYQCRCCSARCSPSFPTALLSTIPTWRDMDGERWRGSPVPREKCGSRACSLLAVSGEAVCPLSWGRSEAQPARCSLCAEQGCRLHSPPGQEQPRGKSRAESREAQRAPGSSTRRACCAPVLRLSPASQREANPFEIHAEQRLHISP